MAAILKPYDRKDIAAQTIGDDFRYFIDQAFAALAAGLAGGDCAHEIVNLIAVVIAGLVLVAGICLAAFRTIITADNYNLQEILAAIPPHWLTILALLVAGGYGSGRGPGCERVAAAVWLPP